LTGKGNSFTNFLSFLLSFKNEEVNNNINNKTNKNTEIILPLLRTISSAGTRLGTSIPALPYTPKLKLKQSNEKSNHLKLGILKKRKISRHRRNKAGIIMK
jgi:hypothetical protein